MEKPLSDPPFRTPVIANDKFAPVWERWISRLRDLISYQQTFEVSFNPANINANTVSSQTVTVSGLTTSDIIQVNPPALTAGLVLLSARVSAVDTVTLTFWNSTGGAINEGAGTYLILAVRK